MGKNESKFSNKSSKREEYKNTARITLEVIEDGFYGDPSGVTYLPDGNYSEVICIPPERIRGFICETEDHIGPDHESFIFITKTDSYRLAYELENALVMNFANAYNPGGGFLNGSNAQEECLCRESTLYKSISSREAADMYRYNKRLNSSIDSDYMLISPHVCVFRDVHDKFLDEPFLTSVVTIPAINLNGRGRNVPMEEVDEVMKQRIKNMLAAALCHGYRRMVLGAWGCGAFGHNPYKVADYFREVLFEDGYKNLFEAIGFAIIDSSWTNNFEAFVKVLGDKAKVIDSKDFSKYEIFGRESAAGEDIYDCDEDDWADEEDDISEVMDCKPRNYHSRFPYIQYNFSPNNVGEENIGYAYGVTMDEIPYMAEKWDYDDEVNVCFYLPVIEEFFEYEHNAEEEAKYQQMEESAYQVDTKSCHVLCVGMAADRDEEENRVDVFDAYYQYLEDVGLLEFTGNIQSGFYQILTDINGNDLFALTVTMESRKEGMVYATTSLDFMPFNTGYNDGKKQDKKIGKETERKNNQIKSSNDAGNGHGRAKLTRVK